MTAQGHRGREWEQDGDSKREREQKERSKSQNQPHSYKSKVSSVLTTFTIFISLHWDFLGQPDNKDLQNWTSPGLW